MSDTVLMAFLMASMAVAALSWSAMEILCNILVTAGVLLSLSAKDLTGRVVGAYLPVAFFVICGFEHCIANLYYIPAETTSPSWNLSHLCRAKTAWWSVAVRV